VLSIDLAGTAVSAGTQLGDVIVINKGSYTRTNGTTQEFLDAALTYFSSAINSPTLTLPNEVFAKKLDEYAPPLLDNPNLEAALAALQAGNIKSGQLGGLSSDRLSGDDIFDSYSRASGAGNQRLEGNAHLSQDFTAIAFSDNKRTGLVMAELVQDVQTEPDFPVFVTTGQSVATDTDRLLALITQDMASFGKRVGESNFNWKTGLADKPTDFFS
jgi:hypothetical protein